jgi:hypothetical protein
LGTFVSDSRHRRYCIAINNNRRQFMRIEYSTPTLIVGHNKNIAHKSGFPFLNKKKRDFSSLNKIQLREKDMAIKTVGAEGINKMLGRDRFHGKRRLAIIN